MTSTTAERTRAGSREQVCADLCSALFASLPRSDQRRRGAEYVRGLLAVPGRKSIRRIATATETSAEGHAAEQSLHHFIVSSTWDLAPVRRALIRFLAGAFRRGAPRAWVVRPVVIPRSGQRSLGVGRRYVAEVGHAVNAQQAVGVWMASEYQSFPVNWRLQVGRGGTEGGREGVREGGPERLRLTPSGAPAARSVTAATAARGTTVVTAATPAAAAAAAAALSDCVLEAVLEVAEDRELPRLPIVMDAREFDPAAVLGLLQATGAPFLLRIGPGTPLVPAPAREGTAAQPAERLLGGARQLRRPVVWSDHHPGEPPRRHLVAGTAVRPPAGDGAPGAAHRPDLLLLGLGPVSPVGSCWPGEYWLTDQTGLPPLTLVRLSRLGRAGGRDLDAITERAGIFDFAGRSYQGWHRHATLASAAHAVIALTGGPAITPRRAPAPAKPFPPGRKELHSLSAARLSAKPADCTGGQIPPLRYRIGNVSP